MTDLLKTAAVLMLIIVLLRRKVSMSVVMPIGALVLGILYLTPPLTFLKATSVAVFEGFKEDRMISFSSGCSRPAS